MAYVVAQLLPDLEEARILRKALVEYASKTADIHEEDLCWGMIAKLTVDMKRNSK